MDSTSASHALSTGLRNTRRRGVLTGDKFQHVPNKAIERKVNQLKVYCTNNCACGCQWVGELSELQSHLEECGFVDVTCTNECVMKLKRKDVAQHHEQCLLRQYKCEYCGHKDTYCTITGDYSCSLRYYSHYETCLNYPLKCPNKCGLRDIRRKDVDDHCEQCPLEPVDCPFREAGCDVKPPRKHLEKHMAAETQQHLLLVMNAHQVLQRRCDEFQMTRSSILASVDSLLETCTEDQKDVLQTVKTVIQGSYTFADRYLRRQGDSTVFKMTNFFHYKQSRRVWHSSPFYIQEGYKMCLDVHAGGVGSGAGSHMSVCLLLMKGEFDNRLKWPLHKVVFEIADCGFYYNEVIVVCGIKRVRAKDTRQVIKTVEKYATHRDVNTCVRDGVLAFNITWYYVSMDWIADHD